MKTEIGLISFTERGGRLARRIQEALEPEYRVICCERPVEGAVCWAERQFAEKNALIFVGACGIAVRAIAPFVKDKLTDSPALVLDEAGRYVIPILSAHMGGANELAELLAGRIGAVSVITSATDVNGKFAVDLFAKRNALIIENKEGVAYVSAKILQGKRATISIEGHENGEYGERIPTELTPVPYPPGERTDIVISTDRRAFKNAVLRLRPKEYILGVGCRKGKSEEELTCFIRETLGKIGLTTEDLAAAASIADKKEEKGICGWAKRRRIPYHTFTAEQLRAVEGDICSSPFVEQTVGVDNVCERAALRACGAGGRLVQKKKAENGMTLAVAKRRWSVHWDGNVSGKGDEIR